jgi:hypothetical protein
VLFVAAGKNKSFGSQKRHIDRLLGDYYTKDGQVLNVLDIAILLGVKQQVAAFWLDRGFIAAETRVGKHIRRQVLKASIEEFCLK